MASPFCASKICACCLLLLTVSGSHAQQEPKVTGFFTDMHYLQDVGDVIGTEVWIVHARGAYWATVQIAEGEPDHLPLLCQLRSLSINSKVHDKGAVG